MTQTIHKVTDDSRDFIAIDLYRHPDDPNGDINDKGCWYCFSVFARKFTQEDLAQWIEYSIDATSKESLEEVKAMIDMFIESGQGYIWRCDSENGHDDYLEFHATREQAECSLFMRSV